jgi:sulfate adenylyltransferase
MPIKPHGNKLVNLLAASKKRSETLNQVYKLESWYLTQRQICDLELLINGGFSPLDGFMDKENYSSVISNMRLANGIIWPIPICLDVTQEFAKKIKRGSKIALRDGEGIPLAIMYIKEIWNPDKKEEAKAVYGTTNPAHPGVNYLLYNTGPTYLGGELLGLNMPSHHSFTDIRHTPQELRRTFSKKGWDRIVAFQTRNPIHKVHFEITKKAQRSIDAKLLINPVVGPTKPGDLDYYLRVRTYKAVYKYYPEDEAYLSLLPLSMRMAGPREALWHAIIRKNYGCTHFIIGRDHAGPGKNFYNEYGAQELYKKYENEIGVGMVPFEEHVYINKLKKYIPISDIDRRYKRTKISGGKLRRTITKGDKVPRWLSFPEVVDELKKIYPQRHKQGFTVFFTGLSGSGKSTVARRLLSRLLEIGDRPATLLDGDIVRRNLSSELGFSKEHRDLNIRRIGFVASEITKNRGIAICAPIAPYDSIRKEVKSLIRQYGGFILVYVSTPLEVCEQRDIKGLYAKARAGKIKGFTGIDDPYEKPKDADLTIDTTLTSPEESVEKILTFLQKEGYIYKTG